jgi:hypothetical protein
MKIILKKIDSTGLVIDKQEICIPCAGNTPDTKQPVVENGITDTPAKQCRYLLTVGEHEYFVTENGKIESI